MPEPPRFCVNGIRGGLDADLSRRTMLLCWQIRNKRKKMDSAGDKRLHYESQTAREGKKQKQNKGKEGVKGEIHQPLGVKGRNPMWQRDEAKLTLHPNTSKIQSKGSSRMLLLTAQPSHRPLAQKPPPSPPPKKKTKKLYALKQGCVKWPFCSRAASALPRRPLPLLVWNVYRAATERGGQKPPSPPRMTSSATQRIMDQCRESFPKDLCLSVHLHDDRV